jgi:polysaccharide biosynthesis protein PslA
MTVAARTSTAIHAEIDPQADAGVRLEPSTARPTRGPMRPATLTPVRSRLTGAIIGRCLRTLDAGMLCLAAAAAFALNRSIWGGLFALIASAFSFGLLPTLGAYLYEPHERFAPAVGRVAGAVFGGALVLWLVQFAIPEVRPMLEPWVAVACTSLALVHTIALVSIRRWRRDGRLTPNVLVVGATENAERLIETALRTREVAVLGVFDDRSGRIPSTVAGVPVLGDTRALLDHRILPYIDRIVLTVSAAGPARTAELIERLRVLPNDLCLFLDGEDPKSRSTTLSWLARSTLSVGGVKARESRQMLKRVQDVVLTLILLAPALPLMGLIALLVRLDSPGPVLFRQRRHGFNNEEITVWKFRSMRTDATDQAGARQVTLDDDRVTRIGRFIRRTSLDELPQFFNVLSGQMSLVGPRPHPIGMRTAGEDSARLVAEYAWRHRMKPGITGWAQIHGSRGPVHTAEEVRRRVELDVDYIERQSFWLDLYIILMTLPRLLGDGEAVR